MQKKEEEAFNAFLALLPTEKRKSTLPKVTACLFPSSAQMSNIPAESDVTLISGGGWGGEKNKIKKSTFLMILFDCDNLGRHCDLLFFFFFSRRFPRLAVDSPIYASNKHFVTSQFILIAPLCQPTALMILRRTLHWVPRCRAFVFSPTARRCNLVG